MALDFDKLKAVSMFDVVLIALCEFSRFVDAIERIAPSAQELQTADAAPKCPCPPELRQKREGVMGEPVAYQCGLCKQPVEA